MGEVDADLVDAAVDVADDELPVRHVAAAGGQGAEDAFVADAAFDAEQPQPVGGGVAVLEAADERGGDEVADVHAEDVGRSLGGGEHAGVPFTGVAAEPGEQGAAHRPVAEEVGLVEGHQLAFTHRPPVHGAGRVPGGQVQQRYGEEFGGRPVLPVDVARRQHQPRHREHGEQRVELAERVGAGGEEQPGHRQLGGVTQVAGDHLAVRVLELLEVFDDLPQRRVRGALGGVHRVLHDQRGVRHPIHRRRQQHPYNIGGQQPPVGGGDRLGLLVRVVGLEPVAPRWQHDRERVQCAGRRRRQVQVLRPVGQLGQRAQPGERSGGVEDDRADAAQHRVVHHRPHEHGLAGAEAADDRDQAGGFADLGGVVRVEHHRAAGRAGGVAEVRAAAVADPAGRGRDAGGHI